MRLAVILFPPLLMAIPFAACAGSSVSGSADAGADADASASNNADATPDGFAIDIPLLQEAAPVMRCKLSGDADPVGLCVQQAALGSLHQHAYVATRGAASSWSSATGAPDIDDAGVVPYTLDDTVAYAAAAANYLASAQLYGDTTLQGALVADLQSIALQLETSFAVPQTEYSGELYFHLRTIAGGLRDISLASDGDKFDLLADTYGRSIYTGHYVALGTRVPTMPGSPEAGPPDGAASDAGVPDALATDAKAATDAHDASHGGHDATTGAHDAGPTVDGILGNAGPSGTVAYAPGDVATAAYALLDMVNRHPMDALVPSWLDAVRASLGHLQAEAVEPTTGMFYQALVAHKDVDGGGADTLAPSTNPAIPSDALLADTQATFALAMIRAQYLVTTGTTVTIGQGEGGRLEDGGVSGPFLPVLDIPFEAWADATVKAMNGVHSLWDTTAPGGGYMDGYVPSTKSLITTKSTRPNALMAGALARALVNTDPTITSQLPALVQLLIARASASVQENSNLITVLPQQVAFLESATRAFSPLTTGPHPTSYTSAAVSVAVEGLSEQLFTKLMQ